MHATCECGVPVTWPAPCIGACPAERARAARQRCPLRRGLPPRHAQPPSGPGRGCEMHHNAFSGITHLAPHILPSDTGSAKVGARNCLHGRRHSSALCLDVYMGHRLLPPRAQQPTRALRSLGWVRMLCAGGCEPRFYRVWSDKQTVAMILVSPCLFGESRPRGHTARTGRARHTRACCP